MPYLEDKKIFWYTPARTASRSCSLVLEYFNFAYPRSHASFYNVEQYDYYFICNVRNPLSRLVSLYELLSDDSQGDMKDTRDFNMWLESKLEVEKGLKHYEWWNLYIFDQLNRIQVKPDYLVKTENLYADICEIPFVKQEMNDELSKILDENIKENRYSELRKIEKNWYEYYNQRTADLVCKNLEYEFEMFNYNTNYWKDGTP